MEFLWEASPRTLMEIVRAMAERTGWAKSTVTTMVARMEGKGLLRYETEGRTKRFYPTMTREEAMCSETDSLLHKAFHGSASLLVSSFLERNRLSREEIGELYELLRKAEEERHD
ncbi:MAG: BlaI/MecI/CopY family transcriptional regulator [Oscillospiraceae bacterium]|nr:BlaI/MecI/CopY family transcriptional regulator [Oscillospiraceae bacterium]